MPEVTKINSIDGPVDVVQFSLDYGECAECGDITVLARLCDSCRDTVFV